MSSLMPFVLVLLRQKKYALGPLVRCVSPKQLTTAPSDQSVMDCFAPRFLAQTKITSAYVVSTNASSTVVSFVKNVGSRSRSQRCVANVWRTLSWPAQIGRAHV